MQANAIIFGCISGQMQFRSLTRTGRSLNKSINWRGHASGMIASCRCASKARGTCRLVSSQRQIDLMRSHRPFDIMSFYGYGNPRITVVTPGVISPAVVYGAPAPVATYTTTTNYIQPPPTATYTTTTTYPVQPPPVTTTVRRGLFLRPFYFSHFLLLRLAGPTRWLLKISL